MNNKPKLFLDIDDTLIQSSKAFCSVYNLLYHSNPLYKFADYTKNFDWNFSETCPLAKDKTEKLFGSQLFFDLVEPMPNAIDILKELKKKYQIISVSIGSYDNISLKTAYLSENFPFIDDFIGIVNSGCKMDKSIINMTSDYNSENNTFIDDNEGNLFSQQNTSGLIRYCYGNIKPWNKIWHDMNGRWLMDWNEIKEELILNRNITLYN